MICAIINIDPVLERLYYWTKFPCPVSGKPNAEKPRFATKKEFIHKAAKQGNREQVLDPPPWKQGGWDIYGVSLVVLSWGKVIGSRKRWGHLRRRIPHVRNCSCIFNMEALRTGVPNPQAADRSRSTACEEPAAQQEVSSRWAREASSAAPRRCHYRLTTLPPPASVEKFSSTKPVPGAKKVGDRWLRRIGGWNFPVLWLQKAIHLHRSSFRVGGPNRPWPARTGQELTPSSCKTTALLEAGKVGNEREEKKKEKYRQLNQWRPFTSRGVLTSCSHICGSSGQAQEFPLAVGFS